MAAGAAFGTDGTFSIREYAAKMRSVDLEKCWPFAASRVAAGEDDVLPPMPVRKFRWWSQQIPGAPQEETHRNSPTTTPTRKRTVNKKRSVVEIFAASPQIAGGGHVATASVASDAAADCGNVGCGCRESVRKKLDMPIGSTKIKSGKKKGGTKKGIMCKPTVLSSHGLSQLLQDLKKKMFRESLRAKRRKKSRSMYHSRKKRSWKGKYWNSLHIDPRVVADELPLQSILKKIKGAPCPREEAGDPNLKLSGESKKHVMFSEEVHILGHIAIRSSAELAPVQGDDLCCDSALNGIRNMGCSVDLNHAEEGIFDANLSNAAGSAISSCSQQALQNLSADNGSWHDFADETFNMSIPCREKVDSWMGNGSEESLNAISKELHAAVRSQASGRNLIQQPSRSHPLTNLSENAVVSDVQPVCHPSCKDMISSLSSSSGSNKSSDTRIVADCMSACRNVLLHEGYVGLPLNLHGELISRNPAGLFTVSGLPQNKFPFLPTHSLQNIGLTADAYYAHVFRDKCEFSYQQLLGFERMEVRSCDHAQDINRSFCGTHPVQCPSDKLQVVCNLDTGKRPVSKPTMRLMGQTVAIGKSANLRHSLSNVNQWNRVESQDSDCSLGFLDKESPYRIELSSNGTTAGLSAKCGSIQTLKLPANFGDNSIYSDIQFLSQSRGCYGVGHQLAASGLSHHGQSLEMLCSSTLGKRSQMLSFSCLPSAPPYNGVSVVDLTMARRSAHSPQWLFNMDQPLSKPSVLSFRESCAVCHLGRAPTAKLPCKTRDSCPHNFSPLVPPSWPHSPAIMSATTPKDKGNRSRIIQFDNAEFVRMNKRCGAKDVSLSGPRKKPQVSTKTAPREENLGSKLTPPASGNDEVNQLPCDAVLKSTGMPRKGPVKLRAGLKHVLGPSPCSRGKNSRTIYTTVLSASFADKKVPEAA